MKGVSQAKFDEMLAKTSSPYFETSYRLSNQRPYQKFTLTIIPSLTTYPVKMLIVSNRMFESTLVPFVEWKTRKGSTLRWPIPMSLVTRPKQSKPSSIVPTQTLLPKTLHQHFLSLWATWPRSPRAWVPPLTNKPTFTMQALMATTFPRCTRAHVG